MKSKFLMLILVLTSFTGLAQEMRAPHSNLANSYGNAPNESEGNLSENIGVDPYTGSLRTGFTLYNYQSKNTGLHHAISLDYQGSGILTDALSSNVGLNWSLSNDCYIHREIKGLPDEDPLGFLNTGAEPTSFTINDSVRLSGYIADSLDGQYDIYRFHAGNSGGQFIIGKNGQIITIPVGNTKIERLSLPWSGPSGYMDSVNGGGFKITTADGTSFVFGQYDCMELDYFNATRHASTTWYVTKIIAPFEKDSILFNYSPVVLKYNAGLNILNYSANPPPHNNDPDINPDPVFCNAGSTGKTTDRAMRLNSVLYPDGTQVSVTYDPFYRLDLVDDNAVNSLRVMNGTSSYSYRFAYSYMQRNSPGQYNDDLPYQDYTGVQGYSPQTLHQEGYSLKLLGFKRFDNTGDSLAGYDFLYNDSVGLPARLSPAGTDLWGYYNGKNNEGRISKVYSLGGVTLYYGASLTPAVYYASAQTLKGVVLPTGGKVFFDFELNTSKSPVLSNMQNIQYYDSVGGLRVKRMRFFDPASGKTITKSYKYVETDGSTSSGVMANNPVNNFGFREFVLSNFLQHVGNYVLLHPCNGNTSNPDFMANNFLVRTSNPQNTVLYTHGSPVGYGRVEEYEGNPASYKSKTVYTFTTADDYPVPASLNVNELPFPNIPTRDYEWGLPTSKTSYTAAGIMQKKTTLDYQDYFFTYDNNNYRNLKVAIVGYPFHTLDSSFVFKISYPVSGKVFLIRSTDSTFFPNNKVVVNKTETVYDTAHNVARYILTTNALNEPIKKQFYYPFDFSMPGAIATLQSKGMIYAPVRSETWKQTAQPQLLDASVINVDQYSGMVRTSEMYDFVSTQPVSVSGWGAFNPTQLFPPASQYLQKVAVMDKYDSKGNPVQITSKGIISSTIWGQNQHYAFATAINAKASDIAFTSFEKINEYGGWVANGGIWSNTSGITGKFAGRLTTTNTVSYNSLDVNKTYTLSVWTTGGTPAGVGTIIASSTPLTFTQGETHQGWTRYQATVSNVYGVQLSSPTASPLFIDELRIYPIDAAMTTYTYDGLYGLTSSTDASNRTIYYEYDGFGRVKYQKDMDGNIIKAYDYKEQDIQP